MPPENKPIIRVLIAKLGLDGHDRGAKVVARGLRDAGFEVIYTGLHQTSHKVVEAALQEDVDLIGLSILSGAHLQLIQDVLKKLAEENMDTPVFVGGIIPPQDVLTLQDQGVKGVFGPGTPIQDITKSLRTFVTEREGLSP